MADMCVYRSRFKTSAHYELNTSFIESYMISVTKAMNYWEFN